MASLNEKIACLGTKHDLEEDKARIMETLTEINLINFNNVERYNKNGNHEVLQAFLKLVNDNLRYSAKSEVISNLNANMNRVNGATTVAAMVKEMITEMRDICIKASEQTITEEQRTTLAFEFKGMLRQAFQIQHDCKFNGMKSLPNFNAGTTIDDMPATDGVMGFINLINETDTGTNSRVAGSWSNFAFDVVGVMNHDVLTADNKGKWKAQIGFDTSSTLTYELYFWGPKFIMQNTYNVGTSPNYTKNYTYLSWTDGATLTYLTSHKDAENCIEALQYEESKMQGKISGYDAVHDYLARQVEVCELENEAALFSIESQRSEAKNALEEELQNLIRQQEYLNAVTSYRPM